ncbi:MAG: hypothetical protein POELPBGB_03531 [Bacteroidia bacterium]|nr:hypothetical protein [Bacteroidia bacterium]
MKKIFTISIFLTAALTAFGQNQFFEFSNLQTNVWGDANYQMLGRADVKNITSDTLHVKLKRYNVDVVSGSESAFCWDLCYTPFTAESVNSLTMEPGIVKTNFYADFFPNGNAGLSKIKYCFFDENNMADSACIMVYFYSSPTGVETLMYADVNSVSSAYPNPATGTTKINYTLRNDAHAAKIEMHNMLGAKVKSIELTEKFAAIELQLSGLEAGVYFYSLVVDDKTIATKKLVVTK